MGLLDLFKSPAVVAVFVAVLLIPAAPYFITALRQPAPHVNRFVDLPTTRAALHSSFKPCQQGPAECIKKLQGLRLKFSAHMLTRAEAREFVKGFWEEIPDDLLNQVLDMHSQGNEIQAGMLYESLLYWGGKANNVALVVIDVQRDFSQPDGSLYVEEGELIAGLTNKLRREHGFMMTVLSKDWHPADHSSFFDNWRKYPLLPGSKQPAHVFDEVTFADGTKQVLWPAHCIQNSLGSQLDPALIQLVSDQIVFKGLDPHADSYSAFRDVKDGTDTPLDQMLKKQKVKTVIIVGLALDFCVRWTAEHAVKNSKEDGHYETYVVADLTRAVFEGNRADVLAALEKQGVKIIQSADVGRILAEAAAAK
eukprot:m.52595 g.52595  ORF g.52595 m.52595 type:complete len:365 (-) comp13089_c0_seq2:420-1514(-)